MLKQQQRQVSIHIQENTHSKGGSQEKQQYFTENAPLFKHSFKGKQQVFGGGTGRLNILCV